jgi:hypothetical protein
MIKKLTSFVSLMIRAVAEIINGLDYVVRVSTLGFGDIDNSIIDKLRGASSEVGGLSMGIMTNSPAPTTVGGAVVKGAVTPSSNTQQPTYIGGGDKGQSRQVIQVVSVLDGKQIGISNSQVLNSSYGNQDFHTGNIPTQDQA